MKYFLIFSVFLFCANVVLANVVINEIMYDLKDGSDTGREWIEIFNNGAEQIDLSGWKLYEAEVNHKIATTTANNFILPAGGFAVIADNQEKFLADWPNFSGVIFDSTFSLNNTGETLILRNVDLADIDTITYTSDMGANGDGKSLQKANNQWVANNPTPGAQNASSQSPEPTSNVDSTIEQQAATAVVWPTEPQIFANAGENKTGVAGADIKFSGQALGIEKEPLENARYLWTFGDGARAEGKTVLHAYQFPGNYIVFLNVSSGKYSTSDRMDIKVGENNLKIVEANKDYVELNNNSNYELDISGWFLRSGMKFFRFPEITMMSKQASIKIPSLISGISKEQGYAVDLLYPNGSVAYSFSKFIEPLMSNKSNTNSTTVVESESQKIEEKPKESQIEELSTSTTQVANIISTTEPNSFGLKKWLTIILGMSVFFAGGFIFIRRQSSL